MLQADQLAERIELFIGAQSETLCRVYARLDVPDAGPGWQITGKLTGPTCLYGETLPATFRFIDRGPGGVPLAEAIVPEPNAWTPEMPHLYQAVVEVRAGSAVLARVERLFGVRPLGAAGRRLRYAGKGWVLRGVRAAEVSDRELAAWHDAETAMVVENPDDTLCAAASRIGVLLVAELSDADADAIRRLSRWPAVGFVSLPSESAAIAGDVGRNLLIGRRFERAERNIMNVAPAGADLVFCHADDRHEFLQNIADCPLPVIPIGPSGAFDTVDQGRAACDQLQRDLAPGGQFAGYIA